jgi:hypothetical protein
MISYKSTSGKDSGVVAYLIGEDYIKVQFLKNTYLYSYSSAGPSDIEEMKKLALNSQGLSTFISQKDPPYEAKY